MPDWIGIALGMLAGLAIVAGAVALAARPRRKGAGSIFPKRHGQDAPETHGVESLTHSSPVDSGHGGGHS